MDHDKHTKERGIELLDVTRAQLHDLLRVVRRSNGRLRVVETHIRGNGRKHEMTMMVFRADDFDRCAADARPGAMFNPERPRFVDENDSVLSVQSDGVDIVMVDAMHGRTLPPGEFSRYAKECQRVQQDSGGALQKKQTTMVERVVGAVKRRTDLNVEPCRREQSDRPVWPSPSSPL